MQDKPKILIVSPSYLGSATANLLTQAMMDVHIVTPEQVKERGIQISQMPEPTPYVIQKLPEPKNLVLFKEEKNYLTGKKLPKRKRRK